MSDAPGKTPALLWIVGIVALLWYAMGCYDYVMTMTGNAAYLGALTPEQVEFVTTKPSWTVGFWALAVWSGLLGALLLLMRKALAANVFLISFLASLVANAHSFLVSDGAATLGTASMIFTGVIIALSLAFVAYARAMEGRGVLR